MLARGQSWWVVEPTGRGPSLFLSLRSMSQAVCLCYGVYVGSALVNGVLDQQAGGAVAVLQGRRVVSQKTSFVSYVDKGLLLLARGQSWWVGCCINWLGVPSLFFRACIHRVKHYVCFMVFCMGSKLMGGVLNQQAGGAVTFFRVCVQLAKRYACVMVLCKGSRVGEWGAASTGRGCRHCSCGSVCVVSQTREVNCEGCICAHHVFCTYAMHL